MTSRYNVFTKPQTQIDYICSNISSGKAGALALIGLRRSLQITLRNHVQMMDIRNLPVLRCLRRLPASVYVYYLRHIMKYMYIFVTVRYLVLYITSVILLCLEFLTVIPNSLYSVLNSLYA